MTEWIKVRNQNPEMIRLTKEAKMQVRSAKKLTAKNRTGRRSWAPEKLFVPVDKWSTHYPNTPVPPESEWGKEEVEGELKQVVYVLKKGEKVDHYHVQEYVDNAIEDEETLNAVTQEDDDAAAEAVHAQKANTAMAFARSRNAKVKVFNFEDLLEKQVASSAKEEDQSDTSEDEDTDDDEDEDEDDSPQISMTGFQNSLARCFGETIQALQPKQNQKLQRNRQHQNLESQNLQAVKEAKPHEAHTVPGHPRTLPLARTQHARAVMRFQL